MIVPISGNVTYPITLDPTVWIFDDRKILLEEAFLDKASKTDYVDEVEKAAQRWSRELFQERINPPVNRSISRMEGKEILKNSYVMPIEDFIQHTEINNDAREAVLKTGSGEVAISLTQLQDSYLLFSVDGKPLKDDGPVHLYYKDGSNKQHPIKGIQEIAIS